MPPAHKKNAHNPSGFVKVRGLDTKYSVDLKRGRSISFKHAGSWAGARLRHGDALTKTDIAKRISAAIERRAAQNGARVVSRMLSCLAPAPPRSAQARRAAPGATL